MSPLLNPWCEQCEQRIDKCHCTPADEFEAMLEEPDEGTLERLRRPTLSSTMTRARHTPRRLRSWRGNCCGNC